jgi:hypothetical protein
MGCVHSAARHGRACAACCADGARKKDGVEMGGIAPRAGRPSGGLPPRRAADLELLGGWGREVKSAPNRRAEDGRPPTPRDVFINVYTPPRTPRTPRASAAVVHAGDRRIDICVDEETLGELYVNYEKVRRKSL